MGVTSPSAVTGVGGCAGREGMRVGFRSRELSFFNSDGVETEGEGGITWTLRLEPPSDGTSSDTPSTFGGDRSMAGVI